MINRVVLEIWRKVPGYEEYYEVSDKGRIRSLDRFHDNGSGGYMRKGKVLKPSLTSTGYKKIELYKDGVRKSFKVHRLVMQTFVGISDELVNHIDGNPLNNKIENLEYCDQSYNMKHAYETGLMECNLYGNEERILREYENGMNIKQLSRKYNINHRTIRDFLLEKGVEIKGISESQRKYQIDFTELNKMFEAGMRNVDIARAFNTNARLIGQYKYKMKKGEIEC